jgi:hypothetical protein
MNLIKGDRLGAGGRVQIGWNGHKAERNASGLQLSGHVDTESKPDRV